MRLSQALARLRFSDTVVTEDVDEALRIIDVSKASLYKDGRGQGTDMTPTTRIYQLICNMRESGAAAVGSGARGELNMNRVRELVIAKGFTDAQFRDAISEYENLDVSLPFLGCNILRQILTKYCSFGNLLIMGRDLFSWRLEMRKTTEWIWTMITSKSKDCTCGGMLMDWKWFHCPDL